MPAFIDPNATEDVALDRCWCPGTPHDHDTVTIRSQYGYGDIVELTSVHTNAGRVDATGERVKLLQIGIKGWTFVDEAGQPVELSLLNIMLLQAPIVAPIAEAIDAAFDRTAPPLPNASGGRSLPSSPASSTARKPKRSRKH